MNLGYIFATLQSVLNLTLPIGWDELGVIATAFAVVVALVANRKATKELNSALEMQEQSKNVGLLDRRIELAENIQAGKPVSVLTLQVLFSNEILTHYIAWQTHLSELKQAENDMNLFFFAGRVEDDEGGYANSVRDTIHKYESDMSRPDCPQEIVNEYETYCNEHIMWIKTGETLELMPFNHSEISGRIATATESAKKEQELTLDLIKKYTSDSIRPLGRRQKKKQYKRKFWKKEDQNDSDRKTL